MAPSAALLSQTLKSITITKIRELQKQRKSFDSRNDEVSRIVGQHEDVRDRVAELHKKLAEINAWHSSGFANIERWLSQARYDPSVSQTKLVDWEKQMLHKMHVEGRKLDLADLYSRLLTEWIEQSSDARPDSAPSSEGGLEDSDSFEVVQSAQKEQLDQLRDKFARVVFEPLETNEVEIGSYLKALFDSDNGEVALKKMNRAVKSKTCDLNKSVITHQELLWTIKALQKNDLLNDEKKSVLQEFLHDEAVLTEILDVLNVRLRDIDTWSWDMGDEGMPVVPRQSLNGKWRVMVDEDVIQALLTHFIGTVWAVKLKETLKEVVSYDRIWKDGNYESELEKKKREYFRPSNVFWNLESLEAHRKQVFEEDFLLAPLPSKMFEEAGGYDEEDSSDDRKSGKEIKQLLLRTLATEVLLRQAFDKEVAVVQSDFQWFATGIPHSTIFATLEFMGFDQQAMTFVRKVLEPPLDMLDGGSVRTRKRGLPMAHVFEKLFGEVVLFFMDLAVNKEASQILYRFHDDLWLVGKPDRCAKAWQAMEQFAKVMGLEFNFNKTGSVYLCNKSAGKDKSIVDTLPKGPVTVHFLELDPNSGEWTINEDHVQQHVKRLRKQLNNATSVLSWIQTWNSCIGRFFSYTFGEPAQCFGAPHLNAILETHQKMQHFLFDGKDGNGDNVLSHLREMISKRFSVSPDTIPDVFIYLPDYLGGLGLKNPFINLCLAQPHLNASPAAKLQKFLKEEQKQYKSSKKAFEAMTDRDRRKTWKSVFETGDDDDSDPPLLSWSDAQEFPPLEEFTRNREVYSKELCDLYKKLMSVPENKEIKVSPEVTRVLTDLKDQVFIDPESKTKSVDELDEDLELMWLLEFYREDLLRDFGGLRCVQRDLLPLGVLGAMRKKKMTWQMVL